MDTADQNAVALASAALGLAISNLHSLAVAKFVDVQGVDERFARMMDTLERTAAPGFAPLIEMKLADVMIDVRDAAYCAAGSTRSA